MESAFIKGIENEFKLKNKIPVIVNYLERRIVMLRRVMALVAAVALGLAGCGVGRIDTELIVDVTSEFETENSVSKSESAQLIFPEKKPIPEGGWTYETIMDSIWVNGQYVRFPCKLEDLGEGFEFVEDEEIFFQKDNNTRTFSRLYFNKIPVASVSVLDETGFDYVNNGYIDGIVMGYDFERIENMPIAINGITLGDSVDYLYEYFFDYISYYDEHMNATGFRIELYDMNDNFISIGISGSEIEGVRSIGITTIIRLDS